MKKITRVDYLKEIFKSEYYWGWLSKSEQEFFRKSPKDFAQLYFKTWPDLKPLFEEYLKSKKKDQESLKTGGHNE